MISPLVWVGSLLLLLCYCPFLLLCLLVFVLCTDVLLCWVHRYLQLLCLPFGLIPWSLHSLFPCLVILFILRSILSEMRIATPAFFCFWIECPEISVRSSSSNVSFKTYISLLIFCFDDLSIGVSGVLKSPTITVLLSVSPFMSVSVCLMFWGAPMLDA